MRRVPNVLFALTLAIGWVLQPGSAAEVSAACSTASCATLEIVFSPGAGSGLVTTFPFGMDCTWTGSTREGTCVSQFDVGGGLDVTLYLDPGAHSYACYGNTCAGLEERLTRVVHLNPGDNIDVFPVFNLAVRATVEVSMQGTGDGRVTSVPAGLNCRWLDGAKSGTCRADFYFYPAASYSIRLDRIPDPGNFACSSGPPFCGRPDQVYTSTLGVSPNYVSGPPATFYVALPVVVAITGSGSVVSNPAGIACPTACSVWLPPNYSDDPPNLTSLTATPAVGWTIKSWSGACAGTVGGTCKFSNGVAGASVGVAFAGPPPTPAPSITPKPTLKPTPRPTVTPRPTASPRIEPVAGASPAAQPSTAAPTPRSSPDSNASLPSVSPPTAEGSPSPVDPGPSTAAPATESPARTVTGSVPGGTSDAGPDLTMIVIVLAFGLVILFAVGYLAGGRRRARSRKAADVA